MLQIKRNKIRQHFRDLEVNQFRSIIRKQLLANSSTHAQLLLTKITAQQSLGINFELVGQLLTYLQTHQNTQNAYILIANYIYDHWDAVPYFWDKLLQTKQLIQNQFWCFYLLADIIFRQKQISGKMQTLCEAVVQLGKQLVSQLKIREKVYKKQHSIWLYLIQIIKIRLQYPDKSILLDDMIQIFGVIFNKIQLSIQPYQKLDQYYKFIKKLTEKGDKVRLNKIFVSFTKFFIAVMESLPQRRNQLADLMAKLLMEYPIQFMNSVFTRNLIQILVYFTKQHQKFKSKGIFLLVELIGQANMNQLIILLELTTHIQLNESLKWAMNNCDNETLENGLSGIYQLLYRLNNEQHVELFQKVKQQLQNLGFHLIIQGLINNSQLQRITNLLNNIVDDFYSQEVSV